MTLLSKLLAFQHTERIFSVSSIKLNKPFHLVRILNPWTNLSRTENLTIRLRYTPKKKLQHTHITLYHNITPKEARRYGFSAGIQSPSRYFITLKENGAWEIKQSV